MMLNDTFRASYAPFWDQYKLSHCLWAPSSAAFCYCGVPPAQRMGLRRMEQECLLLQVGLGRGAAAGPGGRGWAADGGPGCCGRGSPAGGAR